MKLLPHFITAIAAIVLDTTSASTLLSQVKQKESGMKLFDYLERVLELDGNEKYEGPLSDECESLRQVYDGLGIPESHRIGSDCCTWENTCCYGGKVTQIRFLSKRCYFNGTISEAINDLTNLRSLVIANILRADISGTIPPLDNLKELTELTITSSKITGTLPESLYALTNLRVLGISNSFIPGPIPNFGNLTKLEKLSFFSNDHSGTIPDLGNLTMLQEVDFSHNELSGTIPESYGDLPELRKFDVAGNTYLTGEASFLCDIDYFYYWDTSIDQDTCA